MKTFLAVITLCLVGCAGSPVEIDTQWFKLEQAFDGTVSLYQKPIVVAEK